MKSWNMQPQTSWLNSPSCTHNTSSDIPINCHQLFLRVPAKWLLGWQKCLSPQGHQVAPPPGSARFSVFWCVPTQCPTLGGTLASEVSIWVFLCFRLRRGRPETGAAQRQEVLPWFWVTLSPKADIPRLLLRSCSHHSYFLSPGVRSWEEISFPLPSFLLPQNASCLPSWTQRLQFVACYDSSKHIL